ncbi:D-alanyl-D-alanine carboxypeptidase family protein [Pelistega ratti]|uniref:D-alanyl-D-alanine carboxypeptidase family protein n=1 Tax=Pelistega ratti TaxID=2652177 RepID=UPI001954B529|nr:D-alanyl-D-alanine carboxypeptidase family protein [Pelistega ratti]
MSRKLTIIGAAIVVLAAGGYFAMNKSSDTTTTNIAQTVTSSVASTPMFTIPLTDANTPTVQSFSNTIVPTINAKAWMVMDVSSGQIIAQSNPDERVAPASLTKLMTASLVFSAIDNHRLRLDQRVTVSEKAWKTGGSRMFIEVNKEVSIGDLLQGMIVQSGNDATIQLAESVSGSVDVFVDQMNKQAQAFGMRNTHFADPTGLPSPETYTTVRDLSVLAQHIIKDYPDYYHYFSQQEFTYNKIRQPNRNGLLSRNLGVDGLKTGHTDDAGYCLISTAKRDDRRLVVIMMGTKTIREREQFSQQLLDWGYQNFEARTFAPAGQAVISPRVYEGELKNVNLGTANGVVVTVPRDQAQNVQMLTQLNRKMVAPIAKGEALGTVQFVLDGKIVKQDTLVALEDIPQAGFFGRLWDKVVQLF